MDNRIETVRLLALLALIATGRAQAQAATQPCSRPLKEVIYSAVFQWEETPESKRPMRILVGMPVQKSNSSAPWAAQILDTRERGQCQATCEAKPLDEDGIELKCRSEGFNALATPATVFWSDGAKVRHYPAIRFGSWLSGYRHSPLQVELDRFIKIKGAVTSGPISMLEHH